MDPPRTIIIGISGCSSSGKTTLARLLRDMFPETFILHEDDFYKPESELPIKDGLADWDCPEAISIPDLEAALAHVRATGTFPVSSDAPTSSLCRLSRRSSHGCTSVTSPPPTSHPVALLSPSPSPHSTSSSPLESPVQLTRSTTRHCQQPNVNSLEDLNTVGPCPATPDQIAACAAKVRTWLSPDHPGALIFPSSSSKPSPNDDDNHKPPKTRICILDGFLLYSPPPDLCPAPKDPPPSSSSSPSPLRGVMAHLDVKIFLQASKAKALQRRGARDGYVHMDGFWKDPPGYVERIVWPNYVESHRWLFEDGDVEGQGRLDRAVLEREGILAPGLALTSSSSSSGEGGGRSEEGGRDGNQDIEFGRVLEWAVEVVMRELERLCLGEEDRAGQKK